MLSPGVKEKFDFSNLHLKFKNSALCGLKGFVTCNIALLTALQQKTYLDLHKRYITPNVAYSHTLNIIYAKQNITENVIPSLETLLVMPTIFIACYYMHKSNIISINPSSMYLVCLATCMMVMLLICLSLRILKLRKDCCSRGIDHPIYINTQSNTSYKFIQFKGNNSISMHDKTDKKNINGIKYFFTNLLFCIITLPIKIILALLEAMLFCITLLELPLSLLVDVVNIIYNAEKNQQSQKQHSNTKFHHSKQNLQYMCSLFYAIVHDVCIVASGGLLDLEFIITKNANYPQSVIQLIDNKISMLFTKTTQTSTNTNLSEEGCSCMSDIEVTEGNSYCSSKCA
ncbi:hypothetical protein EDL79_03440 [Ehrlichia ruminantium]|uniref:Uncharacterized protein n=1 Tax=Ehrlichia ruminantium TaxID=779 RepID=A0AAE6UKV3_EHRRU|nr:hypothetical protein [Ehrlichia ruminantium]QGR03598.1 hypothetical protein EDL80_03430 [Ehrlichia ruminantium]QGR04525.1 hypothetical protein EDL79_03440 [Ehrlichia ruminantium]